LLVVQGRPFPIERLLDLLTLSISAIEQVADSHIDLWRAAIAIQGRSQPVAFRQEALDGDDDLVGISDHR